MNILFDIFIFSPACVALYSADEKYNNSYKARFSICDIMILSNGKRFYWLTLPNVDTKRTQSRHSTNTVTDTHITAIVAFCGQLYSAKHTH